MVTCLLWLLEALSVVNASLGINRLATLFTGSWQNLKFCAEIFKILALNSSEKF